MGFVRLLATNRPTWPNTRFLILNKFFFWCWLLTVTKMIFLESCILAWRIRIIPWGFSKQSPSRFPCFFPCSGSINIIITLFDFPWWCWNRILRNRVFDFLRVSSLIRYKIQYTRSGNKILLDHCTPTVSSLFPDFKQTNKDKLSTIQFLPITEREGKRKKNRSQIQFGFVE